MSVVEDKDLPEGMKARQELAHQIAEQACKQVWNIAATQSNNLGKQISGNDALSYLGTILQDFCARWICLMDVIREKDDAGILKEEMVKEILNGILATIGCNADYEKESPLPDGIKRLRGE